MKTGVYGAEVHVNTVLQKGVFIVPPDNTVRGFDDRFLFLRLGSRTPRTGPVADIAAKGVAGEQIFRASRSQWL